MLRTVSRILKYPYSSKTGIFGEGYKVIMSHPAVLKSLLPKEKKTIGEENEAGTNLQR